MPDIEIENGTVQCTVPITIVLMPQQVKIQTQADDWTGQSNQAERRRRQNRLNQRAYRKRKAAEVNGHTHSTRPIKDHSSPLGKDSNTTTTLQGQADTGPWQVFSSAIASTKPDYSDSSTFTRLAISVQSDYAQPSKTRLQFQKWIARNHMLGSPQADHVLTLIKFNIFRAIVKNWSILGFSLEDNMPEHAVSPLCETESASPNHSIDTFSSQPTALRPSTIQRRIQHHPWIDFLPFPKMRDNLILGNAMLNGHELCEDLVVGAERSDTGLIAWGEPWDPAGWEITPTFVRKWGWVVEGCTELMVATNHWRAKRGERPLNFARLEDRVSEIS